METSWFLGSVSWFSHFVARWDILEMFATLLYEKAVGASGSGDDSVTEIPELLGLPNIKVDKGFWKTIMQDYIMQIWLSYSVFPHLPILLNFQTQHAWSSCCDSPLPSL